MRAVRIPHRTVTADAVTLAIYILVTVGAILRVVAPLLPEFYMEFLIGGGTAWSLAFGLFSLRYGLILLQAPLSHSSARP